MNNLEQLNDIISRNLIVFKVEEDDNNEYNIFINTKDEKVIVCSGDYFFCRGWLLGYAHGFDSGMAYIEQQL